MNPLNYTLSTTISKYKHKVQHRLVLYFIRLELKSIRDRSSIISDFLWGKDSNPIEDQSHLKFHNKYLHFSLFFLFLDIPIQIIVIL